MTRSKLRRYVPLAAAAVTGVGIPIMMPTPAQAHDGTHVARSGHGNDRGIIYNFHHSVQACNETNDSVATTTFYRTNTGGDTVFSLTDNTFNPPLCATRHLGTGVRVTSFKACSGDISCSAWRNL